MRFDIELDELRPLVKQIVSETVRELGPVQRPADKAAQPADAEPLLLNSREAAKLLSVCERTLWTLTKEGKIPSIRAGRARRYHRADLERWIEREKGRIDG